MPDPRREVVIDGLVVMSEDNRNTSKQVGVLGLGASAERRLGRLGERVWAHVKRKHLVRQVPLVQQLRAVGPVQHLEKSPWKPRGEQRVTIARQIKVERRSCVCALDLLKSMSSAGRPPMWGIRLLSAPLRRTEDDVARLGQACV